MDSRPAKVGDKLTVRQTGSRTRGVFDTKDTNCDTAVCLLPGTEVAFAGPVVAASQVDAAGWPQGVMREVGSTVGIFTQIDMDQPSKHHDAFQFDGEAILINALAPETELTVLQLPVDKQAVRGKAAELAF